MLGTEKALKRMQYFKHKKKDEVFGLLRKWRDEREKEKLEKKWVKVWGAEVDRARRWREVIDDPEVAYGWYMEGFTPAEAKRWIGQGFLRVEDAVDWIDLGFTPREAKRWYEVGVVDPFEASEWEEMGLGPREARRWVEAGINPVEAKGWVEAGFDPAEARRWIRRGYSAQDVARLRARRKERAERELLGRDREEKGWLYKVVAHVVGSYASERRLWEDLKNIASAYGARAVEDLKRAFILDWLKDVDVRSILVDEGKVDVGEKEVGELVRQLEVEFERKGVDFDELVRKAVRARGNGV